MSLHALVGGAGRDAQSDPMQAARMGKCTASANSVLPTGPGPFVMGAQVPLLLRRTQAQFPLGSSKGWGGTGGGSQADRGRSQKRTRRLLLQVPLASHRLCLCLASPAV